MIHYKVYKNDNFDEVEGTEEVALWRQKFSVKNWASKLQKLNRLQEQLQKLNLQSHGLTKDLKLYL